MMFPEKSAFAGENDYIWYAVEMLHVYFSFVIGYEKDKYERLWL